MCLLRLIPLCACASVFSKCCVAHGANLFVGFSLFCLPNVSSGEGVPDWPYYPVLAKFLEGRTEFGDSYDAGSHSYTEPEARPGASHHHPGDLLFLLLLTKQQ